MKKYILTDAILGVKSLINFQNIQIGDLGRFFEKEENLDNNIDGEAWVSFS